MKTSGIPLVLALALLPGPVRAQARAAEQRQAITGVVVEDSTKVPIAGATVTALGSGGGSPRSVQTDSTGKFRIALDSGVYRLRVEQPGYLTVNSDTVSLDEDDVVTVELRLARQAIPLEPLVVTARVDRRIAAFYQRVRKSGWGRFMTRADIERLSGLRPTDLVRQMHGVRVVGVSPCRGCGEQNVIFLSGAGPGGSNQCAPTVFIDGMEVKQDALSPLDTMVMTDQLEGIEVYTEPGTVPNEFMSVRNNCGVVAFWTRPAEGKFSWKKMAIGAGIALLLVLILTR